MANTDILGTRCLEGRAEWVEPSAEGDEFHCALKIDGVIYRFSEDKNDGYRSSCRTPEVIGAGDVPRDAAVVFPLPMTLTFRHRGTGSVDVLYAIDERTGLVVLEIGTDNYDDYYPTFVHRWTPEGYEPDWLAAESRCESTIEER